VYASSFSSSLDYYSLKKNLYLDAVSAMLPLAKQCAFEEPCVETITGENVLTWPHVVSFLIFVPDCIHLLYSFQSIH
jgi:protein arginine N-methyltransferase 6